MCSDGAATMTREQHEDADADGLQRQVLLGAAALAAPPSPARRDSAKSRAPPRMLCRISGSARTRLMMPPAVTAPAPMYST
jgi:hypothetical protein